MAHPHLGTSLGEFVARVHKTKNRLVSIPASIQRELGLERRQENHLVLVSLRPRGRGRWNHHYLKLTSDNELAIPADVVHLRPGDEVEVKVHRVIADVPVPPSPTETGARVLLALARRPRPGVRTDGSERHDDYLREEIRGADRLR